MSRREDIVRAMNILKTERLRIKGSYVWLMKIGSPDLKAKVVDIEVRSVDGNLNLVYVTEGDFVMYSNYNFLGFCEVPVYKVSEEDFEVLRGEAFFGTESEYDAYVNKYFGG
jgi:hypothetical protein